MDPSLVPSIGFLTGDFGEAVFAEYQKEVAKYNSKAKETLGVLQYDAEKNVVIGSNPFAVAVINNLPIMGESGLRVATQPDLELMLRAGDSLKVAGNHYIHTGLVLRSEDDPNGYLTKTLAADIKAQKKQDTLNYPLLLNLRDVRVEPDEKSPYGLMFKLKPDAKPVHAPILNKPGYFGSQDIDVETGLPKETVANQTEERNRQLYITTCGLVWLGLDGDLDLHADSGRLAYSNSVGRVGVVGASEASASFLRDLKTKFEEETRALSVRYAKARNILNGKE